MKKIFFLIIFCLISNISDARKVCKPPVIKSEKEIFEKLKICNKGDKLLLFFDIKLNSEDLIVNLCNLEHTIITRDEKTIVHKRRSGLTIICIYQPNKELFN